MLSQPLMDWQNTGDFFDYQQHRIFYKTSGAGSPLLLIHGFPSASWDWQPMWAALSTKFRLITADMLGFGLSDKPKHFDYTIAAQADLYEMLMSIQGVESAHILAHDYGDTVAQELLARHNLGQLSFHIESVTFLNGGLFPETHRPLLVQKLLMSPVGGWIARLMTKQKFMANFQRICSSKMTCDDIALLWELLMHHEGRAVMPKLICYMKERKQFRSRWVGALQETDVPLHLIDGLIDPISGAHLVERFRELVPNGRVSELAGIGHYPQVEAPEQVCQAFQSAFAEAASLSTSK